MPKNSGCDPPRTCGPLRQRMAPISRPLVVDAPAPSSSNRAARDVQMDSARRSIEPGRPFACTTPPQTRRTIPADRAPSTTATPTNRNPPRHPHTRSIGRCATSEWTRRTVHLNNPAKRVTRDPRVLRTLRHTHPQTGAPTTSPSVQWTARNVQMNVGDRPLARPRHRRVPRSRRISHPRHSHTPLGPHRAPPRRPHPFR